MKDEHKQATGRHQCRVTGCKNWNLPNEPHCVTHRTMNDKLKQATLLRIQKAIDAILNVVGSEAIPTDRYRETLNKLRSDEHKITNS